MLLLVLLVLAFVVSDYCAADPVCGSNGNFRASNLQEWTSCLLWVEINILLNCPTGISSWALSWSFTLCYKNLPTLAVYSL